MTKLNFRAAGLAAALLASTAICATAKAQTMNYGALQDMFGEPVTTSATGSPQKATEAPVSMEIISAEEIKRSGAVTVPEILQRLAGMDVFRHSAQYNDVGIRGYTEGTESSIQVLIDGRSMYEETYAAVNWNRIPVALEQIRQIEIVRGPASALFGFNAAGGVVNIVTYNPGYDAVTSATARLGTQGRQQVSGTATYKISEGSGLRLSGNWDNVREFKPNPYIVPFGPPIDKEPEAFTFSADGIIRLNADTQSRFEITRGRATGASMIPSTHALPRFVGSHESYLGEVVSNTSAGLINARYFSNEFNHDSARRSFEYTNKVEGALIQDVFKIGPATTARMALEWRQLSSVITLFGVPAGNMHETDYSGSAMVEHHLTDRMTLTLSGRYDRASFSRTGGFPADIPFKDSDFTRTLNEYSYNVGLVTKITDDQSLRLTASRGLNLPQLGGTGVNGPFRFPGVPFAVAAIAPAPKLPPIVFNDYEIGWDWALADGSQVRTTAFYQQRQNMQMWFRLDLNPPDALLPRVGLPPLPVGSTVVLGDSSNFGLEFSYKRPLAAGWSYGANATVYKINDKFNPIYVATRPVNYERTTPKFSGNLQLGWQGGNWTFDGYLKLIGERDGFKSTDYNNPGNTIPFAPNYFGIPTAVNLDVRAAYAVTRNMTFALEGSNLVDGGRTDGGYKIPAQVRAALRFDY